ncbi:MAG: 16S rRNA (cytidine(1402)-2'-O)-methyltransferase [Burkholderiaceae bacterium]|jgi:16S rRNA (cytidine1402-2'-O)-methyltransferase|nr:16S rRNA (cytidine(1402)-2'-O)-methyltransferase [Burkholderiaceae bacterium]
MTDSRPVGKPDYGPALHAARQAAGAQHYPAGCLYVVATPIGNLADITLRALHVLDLADVIACEDTRQTRQLLRAYGIDKAVDAFMAAHEHNETRAAQAIIARLQAGQRVAYASDAGTPAISDPGARLVAACAARGVRAIPVPGASCVTAALSAAGIADDGRYVFEGFLPAPSGARQAALACLQSQSRAIVLLEAPHRIAALADALAAAFGARAVTVARELTKQFEQIATLPCADLPAWLAADAQRQRGEFALILHPAPAASGADADAQADRLLALLLAELPLKTAVHLAAEISGGARNALYARALALRAAQPQDKD